MASVDLAPPNNFETNAGTFAGGKNLQARAPEKSHRPGRKKGKASRSSARSTVVGHGKLIAPTPERMAKVDAPIQMADGRHRAPEPIERLFSRGSLDPVPHVNSGMYEAALKLQRHFYGASLVGVKAQDLNKVVSHGSGDALNGEENWVYHFDIFRKACKMMGWHDLHPHRGAGRLVVSVICYEMGVKDAALRHLSVGKTEIALALGMDRLREGLLMLALMWKLC